MQTRISESSIPLFSLLLSPIAIPTLSPTKLANSCNSSTFSEAKAFSGTIYKPLAPFRSEISRCIIVRWATNDFPLAVGIVSMTLCPASAYGKASRCGGNSSSIPHSDLRCWIILSSTCRSARHTSARSSSTAT